MKRYEAEREGERGEPRVVRGVGEAIGARRQRRGERTRPKQILAGVVLGLEREQHVGKRPVGPRQQQVAAGLGFEASGIGEGPRARIEPLAQGGPSGGVNEGYRNRRGGLAAGKKARMHRKLVLNGPC